jgi:hypothetical protein
LIIWVPPNAEPLGIKPSKDFFDWITKLLDKSIEFKENEEDWIEIHEEPLSLKNIGQSIYSSSPAVISWTTSDVILVITFKEIGENAKWVQLVPIDSETTLSQKSGKHSTIQLSQVL